MQTICTLIDIVHCVSVGFIAVSVGIIIYSLVYSVITDIN